MRLIDLFDIIYVDEVIQNHLEDKINNIKIHNFLNLNRNLTNQFLLIISKNIIYNKSYNKIKLEFHNSNLNSNLIGNIFEKIQELVGVQEINEFNDVIENDENVILYQSNYDVDDGVDGVGEDGGDDGYGEDGEDDGVDDGDDGGDDGEDDGEDDGDGVGDGEDGEDDGEDDGDGEDGEVEAKNIKIKFVKTEYIQIHLFQKKFDDNDKIKYISTFFFNDKIKIEDCFDITKDNLGKFDLDENILNQLKSNKFVSNLNLNKLTNIEYYYTNNHRNYNDIDPINNYIDKFDILDNYLINNIDKIMSGFYLNLTDIKFQLILRQLITIYIGHYGNFIKLLNYKEFKLGSTLSHYFNYDKDNSDIFENLLITNLIIECDKCNIYKTKIYDDLFYHNDIGGDLCSKCYNEKINEFNEKIKYIKNRILRIGKIELFKKEIIKTREFLKNKKFKCKKKNYYSMLENMNKKLVEINSNHNTCTICYENLTENIHVGSKCGHCFHQRCIDNSNSDICQICRVKTEFVKLYLN